MVLSPKHISENGRDYLFEGASMAIFELDSHSDERLISELKKASDEDRILSRECRDLLAENINELFPNNIINKTSNEKALPLAVILPISSGCNLNCSYCFAQTNGGKFNFHSYTESDMERLITTLDTINCGESTTLIFLGGEPLLKFQLIKYTVNLVEKLGLSSRFSYSITTNGTLINREIALFFKKHNFAIMVSMDGYDNKYNYRRFRNGDSSVAKVLSNISLLKELGVPFMIRATITSDNPFVFETFCFFEKLQIPYTLAFAYPSDNKDAENLSTYSDDDVARIANGLSYLLDYYRKAILRKEPIYNHVVPTLVNLIEHRTIRERICSGGINYFTILSDGTLFSCAHLMNDLEESLGNIFHDNLFPIAGKGYPISPTITSLEDDCLKCWAKHICSGGCPAQKHSCSLAPTSSLPEGQCKVEKILAEFYIRVYINLKQSQEER